jgi:hypothetical protein
MEIEELRAKYLEKFGKEVPARYRNDDVWILSKINPSEVVDLEAPKGTFTLNGADGTPKKDRNGKIRLFTKVNDITVEVK